MSMFHCARCRHNDATTAELPSCAVVGGGKEVAPVCLCIASQRLYLEMNVRFLAFDLYWHEWTPNA